MASNRDLMKCSVRIGILAWAGLTAGGWLRHWLFLAGLPGIHWLALAYSYLLLAAVVVMLVSLPIIGAAFGVLALIGLKAEWRCLARRAAQKLLLLLLVQLMAIIAFLPSFLLQYQPYSRMAIAPWHVVYRVVYVSPLDNNYGDLMLLQCHRLGVCHQVYRSYTNIISAEEAFLDFNSETNQVALHLEGRWVYVRSPNTSPVRKY